jgi:hypothetical protein
MVWIGKPWALERQLLSTTKWADPLNGKFFTAVACPKPDLVEFSHPCDQCFQAQCQFRLLPLIINMRQKEMLVRPLGFNMYINMELFLGGAFSVALELGIWILISTMVMQRQPNPREDMLVISSRRIKIPEHTSIRGNP